MADEKIVTGEEKETPAENEEDLKTSKKDEEAEEEPEKKPEEEAEVPFRTATLQHIIARKNKQIEKLKSKTEEEEEEAGEEELTPEAKSALDRELDRRFAPFREQEIHRESENLLTKLYGEEPEAKDWDKLIRRFMTFETKNGVKPYEHIPPEVIYHHLAFGKAEAAGAQKRTAADLVANLSRTKGRTNRSKSTRTESGLPTIDEMESMSDAEFAKTIITPTLQG